MSTVDYNLYARFAAAYHARTDAALLLLDDGQSRTFAELDAVAAQMQSLLCNLGVRAGDRVSVQVDKSPEALCLYLACLRGGYVYHPLNPSYTDDELAYFLDDAGPAIVICSPARRESVSELCVVPTLTLDVAGGGTLMEFSSELPLATTAMPRAIDDLAALLYSSGTTGKPKGVMLSCGNLVSNTSVLVDAWGFSHQDCLLHVLPIFHVHGLFVAIGCAMLSGARMRWLEGFDAMNVTDNLADCTVMMGVPTYYTRLLDHAGFGQHDCRTIRLFISGSAPLRAETFTRFEERTGHRILERYGMTETNMNASNPLHGERRPGTVGTALPGVSLRVVDGAGARLASGSTGDLQVKGPNVFMGYWNNPEASKRDFTDDGYFNTGDLATLSADGYLSIVGRTKDLIITGGMNVYPKEVELVLDALPGIVESAVIGIPHDDFGEAVVAVVVRDDGMLLDEGQLLDSMKAQLAGYKIPKKIVAVEKLPRNSMSKVQKNTLRSQFAALFSPTLSAGG